MGSLTSRPSIPQAQQPVIVTVPQSAPVTASPVTQTPKTGAAEETGAETVNTPPESTSSEEAQRLAREDNLLRRSRGRLGTVLTGFNGLLEKAAAPVRKTLLGE